MRAVNHADVAHPGFQSRDSFNKYNVQLRSVLADKEDTDRGERQSNQATRPGTTSRPGASTTSLLAGERGDLTAVR
jgi:hypothetical protein